MGPLYSLRIPRVRRYSGFRLPILCFAYEILTLFDWPSHVIRLHIFVRYICPYPVIISDYGLASSDFARHYSRNLVWFLFLSLLRCFSSGGSLPQPMYSVKDLRFFTAGVAPFGNLRVKGYFHLTVAYRRLSRPSSALSAKAFTLRSFSLEQPFAILLTLSSSWEYFQLFCLSFANNCFLGCKLKDLLVN